MAALGAAGFLEADVEGSVLGVSPGGIWPERPRLEEASSSFRDSVVTPSGELGRPPSGEPLSLTLRPDTRWAGGWVSPASSFRELLALACCDRLATSDGTTNVLALTLPDVLPAAWERGGLGVGLAGSRASQGPSKDRCGGMDCGDLKHAP